MLFLFLGAILGALGWRYFERLEKPALGQRVDAVADQAQHAAGEVKKSVVDKAEDWKLTPESIKAELARTGRVVRSKTRVVGDRIDDARIIAVLKGKYVVDDSLSVLAISVDCRDGEVKLTGSASTPENIGRAVTLALDTRGVHHVISQLVVRN